MATVKVQGGRAITSGRMIGTSPAQAEPRFIGVGTGAGTAAVGDTTLFTEVGSTRVAVTSGVGTSQVTTTTTNDTYRIVGTYTNASGGAQTITNVGTFDNATVGSGTLNIKGDLAASAILQIGDSLALTIDEKFA